MLDHTLAGAYNLLVNCGQANAGEHLLLCYEPEYLGYYDAAIVHDIKSCAAEIGLNITLCELGFEPFISKMPPHVEAAMAAADLTVFLARAADQLRFSAFKANERVVVSFALNGESLASPFGTVHYSATLALQQAIDTVLFAAEEIVVTNKSGTEFIGKIRASPEGGDANVRRFPMLVNTPAPACGFAGRIALPGFLVGTGSKYYSPYSITFEGQLFAVFEGNTLAGFEGKKADEDKANRHLDYVADQFGINRNFVHSWHIGIHPGCYFDRAAVDHFDSWGGSAFGNPRILHMHTCGAYAPGEVCWNVIDPSIVADGVTLWQDGVLYPERVAGGADILAKFDDLRQVFQTPDQRIGL
ncbi:MAG: hypothetical protein P8M25_20000 [Paracoccaceae bacterium]|nr:hypothetical protein [Paracoccaceae bacterium]